MTERIIGLIKSFRLALLFGSALFSAYSLFGQHISKLSIHEAYQMARNNYPLIKQQDLISKTKVYSFDNAGKGYLPALSFSGQATYQSDVTALPFKFPTPGIIIPNYSKDQYKLYGEIDQLVYDGGVISNQKQTALVNEVIQQQNLKVQLYALYDRVNQLFFGAILLEEQIKQNDLLKKDIQNGIDKTRSQVENGTAYRSSVDELTAQLYQADQNRVELQATRKAYRDMLGLFINQPINENVVLEQPVIPELTDSLSRPELLYYDYQKKTFDLQDQYLKTQLRPKFSLFFQGGYGRPGLNFLSNDFAWYYIGGARLSWNLASLYTFKNQKQLSEINRQSLDIQKETFLLNTRITQKQEHTEIDKYLELLKKDDAIISLRELVKNAASAQLANGVLSARDYISEVNAEDQARQNRILHVVQLLQTMYSYQTLTGINN
jgi:outer membrane protein TolC